jgi:putative flippase GtrA
MKNVWDFRPTRFVAVGIINTIVDFVVLNILAFSFDINKILANTISVSIAMTVSYFLNRQLVFKYEGKDHAKRLFLFIIITVFGLYVIQNSVIFLLVRHVTFPAHLATSIIHGIGLNSLSDSFIGLNLAKAIATGITMVWNYFMYKHFVFSVGKPTPTEKQLAD